MATDARSSVHLEVRGLGKSFGATRALDDVSIEVESGTVHAFVGENGAGKSTLGKIVAGVFPPDQGDLVLRGEPVAFGSPREALERGIAIVAQEVALVPQLTVAQNVFLGAEPRRAGFIDRRALAERFALLATNPGSTSTAAPSSVRCRSPNSSRSRSCGRWLARPTSSSSTNRPRACPRRRPSGFTRSSVRSARGGRTVILVSHFLAEVLALADTVTVLRDGRVVRTGPAKAETENSLVAAMLGRPAARAYPAKQASPPDSPVVLSIRHLSAPGVHDVSLDLRSGEIVGVAGLIGAGRSELARAIYGVNPATGGEVESGSTRLGDTPAASLRAGVAMIPESRKDDGLFLRRPIRENVSLSTVASFARFGFVRRGRERSRVSEELHRVAGSPLLEAPAGALSGGNQQKLLFARTLLVHPGVLIADEPTRGVDVGVET